MFNKLQALNPSTGEVGGRRTGSETRLGWDWWINDLQSPIPKPTLSKMLLPSTEGAALMGNRAVGDTAGRNGSGGKPLLRDLGCRRVLCIKCIRGWVSMRDWQVERRRRGSGHKRPSGLTTTSALGPEFSVLLILPRPPRALPLAPRPGRGRLPKLISSWDVMSLAAFRKTWDSSSQSSFTIWNTATGQTVTRTAISTVAQPGS